MQFEPQENPPTLPVLLSIPPKEMPPVQSVLPATTAQADVSELESVESLMEALQREMREARRRKRRARWKAGLTLLVMLAVLFCQEGQPGWLYLALPFLAALWTADFGVGKRRQAAYRLSRVREPRSVGMLALALRDGDGFVRTVAEEALCSLLPRLQPADAVYFSPEQWNALLLIAFGSSSSWLKIALLESLGRVGDVRALPAVQHLLQHDDPAVRSAATNCLPLLEARQRDADARATLLRSGSEVPSQYGAVLLRPSHTDTIATRPEQLLRAAQGEASEA